MRILITGGSEPLSLGSMIAYEMHNYIDEAIVLTPSQAELDVSDTNSISNYVDKLSEGDDRFDILVYSAGVNDIDWFDQFEMSRWDRLMNTNARGIMDLTQQMLPFFQAGATICNIISNASHVPMTNSAAYNASKGAAHILTKAMARELKATHQLTVFGVSPNKLAGTNMSKYIDERVPELRGWSPEEARQYQLNALPAGEETDPHALAEFIAFLLSTKSRHKYLNGCVIPYGA